MTDRFKTFYMNVAYEVSKLSYCENRKVGCIIVDGKGNNILSFGFNGCISGMTNMCEDNSNIEIWKTITDFPEYEISTYGNVKRLSDGKLLNKHLSKKGYYQVKINNVYKVIHRLVAKTFIYNPNVTYYNQVNHIDNDKCNNNVYNLEWCTNRYNCEQREHFLKRNENIGVIYNPDRPTKPYQGRVYVNHKVISKRFEKEEDAVVFVKSLKNEKDFITYKYYGRTLPEVLHAESNGITKLARCNSSSDNAILFTTTSPCIECSKLIIQSGIKEVYYSENYRTMDGVELLKKANIKVEQYEKT